MIEPKKRSFQRIPFWELRGEFHSQGWFDQDIADAIGMTPGTLSTRMQGRSVWRADEISKICELLNITQENVGRLFFPDIEAATKKPARAGTRTSLRVTG